MTFKYATLPYTPEAFTALSTDLDNHMANFFAAVFVSVLDIKRGDTQKGNTSAFIAPDTTLAYFVKYDETLLNLNIFNTSGFEVIQDLDSWRQSYTIA